MPDRTHTIPTRYPLATLSEPASIHKSTKTKPFRCLIFNAIEGLIIKNATALRMLLKGLQILEVSACPSQPDLTFEEKKYGTR